MTRHDDRTTTDHPDGRDATDQAEATRLNRRFWERDARRYQRDHSPTLEATPWCWGTWRIPETGLGALGDVRDKVVVELGCGGGQWAGPLTAAGARVIGVDLSLGQLRHARTIAPRTPFVQASGDRVPLRDGVADVVMSDHGAATFLRLHQWLPEAARLLRPGGRLAVCIASPWKAVCTDEDWQLTEQLHRPYFDIGDLTDGRSVDWAPTHGEWIGALVEHGFVVEALHELRPPEGATTTYDWFTTYEWASRWPAEDLWVALRQAPARPARRRG
jgi:SAM-dependent methyltransferase